MIKAIIFDWGDTIMRDFPGKKGPMYQWDHVEWIPGAEDALKMLVGKCKLIIATSAFQSDTNDMIKALERVGAHKYFDRFFSSKDLGYEKSDVRFYKSIARSINVLPENCAMVGNLYEKDIVIAKECGMFTVFFNKEGTINTFEKADKIINSFEELTPIFYYF